MFFWIVVTVILLTVTFIFLRAASYQLEVYEDRAWAAGFATMSGLSLVCALAAAYMAG